jgi:hypothetical protein
VRWIVAVPPGATAGVAGAPVASAGPGAPGGAPAIALAAPAPAPSSARCWSIIAATGAGGFIARTASQRLRATAASPRTAAAKPPYSSAFGLLGASVTACFEQLCGLRRDLAAGAQAQGFGQTQDRLGVLCRRQLRA